MKSLLKVLALVSLIVISRLDKQNWQLTDKPAKEKITVIYPLQEHDFSKAVDIPVQ